MRVHDVHIPQQTIGISPKVIAGALAGLVLYLLSIPAPVPPAIEQAVNVLAVVLVAYWAPPGAVPAEVIGPRSDDLLNRPTGNHDTP